MPSIQSIRNNYARKFEQNCKIHRNCVRLGRNQTYAHAKKIFDLAWDAYINKQEFLTEATLEGNKARADFVILDNGNVIEVAYSEDIKSLNNKQKLWEKEGFGMGVINV